VFMRCVQGFGGENHYDDLNVDGRIILKWIVNTSDGGMDRIDLAYCRDRWRDLVHSVMNIRVS
jgi:hypothetical protein